MNYSGPINLAILACPGGEVFADEVIFHLKKCYRRKFSTTVSNLAKKYNLDAETVIQRINFINDTAGLGSSEPEAGIPSHTPRFKVPSRFTLFANGEIKAEILESIRGKDVYIVQDVENHYPVSFNNGTVRQSLSVNDHLMTIFVTVDAVKQAGAERITLVLPIYPYSRQHKKKGREGVTASRAGYIMESLGVNRIITLDIHSREIGNAFNFMRLENLHASYQIIRQLSDIAGIRGEDFVVVSPDTGAVDRNKFYASAFKKPLALLYKERDYSRVSRDALENNISEIKLLGSVRDKTVFMADDMLGTGGTLLKAMGFLKEQGAGKVICAVSLPVFSGKAIEYFDAAYQEGLFYRIIGTNAIYHEELLNREWYISVNITKLFAQIISRLHQGLSLSSLLDNRAIIEKLLAEH
ncbi:MAG: ribose-phosphate diphosphokinase [Spirochaetaceae bacterium]|jgi:ribose-phosphate pyrophosphokinase|nr:ribose-phosphate diphosphokinase [Spirochaetaceae bacterium]